MKLRIRRKSKKEQVLDALASVAKTWSEWQLGKRAAKTVTSGARKASTVRHAGTATWLKVVAGVALVGGVGAGVARKVKGGGGAEPIYTPPVAQPPTDEPVSPATPSSAEVGVGVSSSAAEQAAGDIAAPGAPADISKVSIDRPGGGAEPASAGEATKAGHAAPTGIDETAPDAPAAATEAPEARKIADETPITSAETGTTERDAAAMPDHDDEPRRSADEHPGVADLGTTKKPS